MGSRELGGYRVEEVILLAAAHGDAHAFAEGTHDEADAGAFVDEAVDASVEQVEVRLCVGDIVSEVAQGGNDTFAFSDDVGDRALNTLCVCERGQGSFLGSPFLWGTSGASAFCGCVALFSCACICSSLFVGGGCGCVLGWA